MRFGFNIIEDTGLSINLNEAKTHHRIAHCGDERPIYLGRDRLLPEQWMSE